MIVILTALQGEHRAVRKHLSDLRTHSHPAGTLFDVGVLAAHQDRHVALGVIGDGNGTAATLTERAINEFQPEVVMFVGKAGALHNWLNLGDIVVATRVYAVHGGRSDDDKFRVRPRAWDASHQLEQVARLVDRSDAWRSFLPESSSAPSIHFNPIAAGEVVLSSKRSRLAQHLRDHYNDAVAIEMEGAGVALAGHLNLATPTIMIRGISDYAHEKDITDQTTAPQLAVDNAAGFAMAFIARLDLTACRPNRPGAGKPKYGAISNSVSGHAQVVAQIGVVNGGVQIGSPDQSKSTSKLLVQFSEAVFTDFRQGLLDQNTFTLGMLALDDARALTASTAPDLRQGAEIVRRLEQLFGHRPALRSMIKQLTFGRS